MFTVGPNIVIFNEAGQMVVRSSDPVVNQNIRNIPYVQVMPAEGDQLLAMMPWCEDSCKLFNNAGIDMTGAAPFWHSQPPLVEGKYPPLVSQLFTAAFITLNPRCYVLSDPRTGKTGSLILGMDYLQKQRYVAGGWLVITTVTTMQGVWYDGIKNTLPTAKINIVHGKRRTTSLHEPAHFYITNYDSCRLSQKEFVEAVRNKLVAGVVIDELTHIGNPSSQRHKAIDAFTNKLGLTYVIGATGSPGNNPESVYGMARMINRWKLPCTTKTAWMDLTTYQYGSEVYMRKMSPSAPKIIYDTLQPAVRFKKEDIIDLPPVVTQDRECELSPEQKHMREQFKRQAVALHKSGETITCSNGGVLAGKLLQVASGFVYDNEGKPILLDYKARLKTIIEVIQETPRKTVIFCTYTAAIYRLQTDLEQAGYSVGVITGDVNGTKRSEILHNFQNKTDPHILIAHCTTCAYGTELSVADTMIFASVPQLGGFIWAQALERLSSSKQTAEKISIIRIISSPEERTAYNGLDSGQKVGQIISGLFEELTRGV